MKARWLKDRLKNRIAKRNQREAECELGARKTEMMRSPSLPNGAEVEEHEKTHLPFRSWCRHCVRGEEKQAEHRRMAQEKVGPEMHMDFAFMGDEEREELLTILVAKKRTTRMLTSTVVQAKSSAEFAAKRTLAFLREIGCEHVAMTVKSVNEPAMCERLGDADWQVARSKWRPEIQRRDEPGIFQRKQWRRSTGSANSSRASSSSPKRS